MNRSPGELWSRADAEWLYFAPPLVPSGASPQIALDSYDAVQLYAVRFQFNASVAVADRYLYVGQVYSGGLEWQDLLFGPVLATEARILWASRDQKETRLLGTQVTGVIASPIIDNPTSLYVSAVGIDVADVISNVRVWMRGWRRVGGPVTRERLPA